MDIDARAVVTLVKPEATVSHTSLKSTISTVRMESVATLADGSLNKWLYEDYTNTGSGTHTGILLAEVYLSVYTKPFTENLAISEVYGWNLQKTPATESLSIAETFAKVVSWNRNINDAFTLDDAATIDKDYYGNKGNVFQILDILDIEMGRGLTDSYTVGDVVAIAIAYNRTPNETLSTGDVPVINNRSGALMNGTFFNNITLN